MLHAKKLPYHFWGYAMNTACYIHNRVKYCGREENPMLNTFMYLEANATYWLIENKEGRWILKVMKESSLIYLQTTEPTGCLTPEPKS